MKLICTYTIIFTLNQRFSGYCPSENLSTPNCIVHCTLKSKAMEYSDCFHLIKEVKTLIREKGKGLQVDQQQIFLKEQDKQMRDRKSKMHV